MGQKTINTSLLSPKTIDRALYPENASEISITIPGSGDNPFIIDLQSLWSTLQFAATGIIVDLSNVLFFSNDNVTGGEFFSQGFLGVVNYPKYAGGPGFGQTGLTVMSDDGTLFYCRCREVTTIPLSGKRTGTLTINFGQTVSLISGATNQVLYPIGLQNNSTNVIAVSFPVTLLNVPVEFSRVSYQKEFGESVFSSELDEQGSAMALVLSQDLTSGAVPKTTFGLVIPQRIVSYNNNDGGGPYCAPETHINSHTQFSQPVQAMAAQTSSIALAGQAPQQQHKLWQHLFIQEMRWFFSGLNLAGGSGNYRFQVSFNVEYLPGPATRTGFFFAQDFFWSGMDDFEFFMSEQFYINILDFIEANNMGSTIDAGVTTPTLIGSFINVDTNTVSDYQAATMFDAHWNLLENPINQTVAFQ